MKKLQTIILLFVLTFSTRICFSQTTDSLGIYPNPFKDTTTIHFSIAQASTVSLSVYNLLGEKIRTYFQATYLQSGSYSNTFIADTLPDGMYFVALYINSNKPITKKVVKTNLATSIKDIKADKRNLLLMPNPTKDFVTIPLDGVKLITVTDINGRIIKSIRTEAKILSLEDLQAGVYLVTILTDKQELVKREKIIKIE